MHASVRRSSNYQSPLHCELVIQDEAASTYSMWCTRWFLPLLLLPLPTASPYFLFLFFFSLTLHARPCFYCIILLTALFTSSCYWQPVPTSALFQGAFPSISHSAPLLYHPNASISDDGTISASQLLPVPRLTKLLDRCWCDLSGGHLFDPYNITLWQLTSLSRTLGATESQRVLVAQEIEMPAEEKRVRETSEKQEMVRVWVLKATEKVAEQVERVGGVEPPSMGSFGRWLRPSLPSLPLNISLPFPFNFGRRSSHGTPNGFFPNGSSAVANSTKEIKLPLLRRRYDLRSHGVDLIIDFGWGRSYG